MYKPRQVEYSIGLKYFGKNKNKKIQSFVDNSHCFGRLANLSYLILPVLPAIVSISIKY
ncbi:3116_t:CDS:2 [Entrophospora sp. SA101]|nr:3116_t:CDS:2 [Entrophospora sp. SA101]